MSHCRPPLFLPTTAELLAQADRDCAAMFGSLERIRDEARAALAGRGVRPVQAALAQAFVLARLVQDHLGKPPEAIRNAAAALLGLLEKVGVVQLEAPASPDLPCCYADMPAGGGA